ncbi:MAG: Inner membrane protein YrbG, partial [Alphaproteobacteria bacterium MarineAlpha6_Bin2]
MNLDTIFITLASLIILLFGANYLVKNIVYLGKKINVSNFVIASLTLAFGTTIPEFAVSLNAVLSLPPHPGIAVGNIFGSNIANILLILGVAALIYPIKINYDKLTRIEIKINFLIIFFPATIIFFNIANEGSFILSCIAILTLIFLMQQRFTLGKIDNSNNNIEKSLISILFTLFLSLLAILIGSHFLLNGSIKIAEYFHISERVIGLSLVAIGTSLPELTTAIMASLKKIEGVALGNVLGANTYNILGILGIVEIIERSSISKNVMSIDIYFLTIATLLLSFVLWKRKKLDIKFSLIFLTTYIFYIYL